MIPHEAGLKILGLVCGLPGDRALRRQFLMLKAYKAYVDGSGNGDPNLLVLAGYVAPAQGWIEFSEEWQRRLNQARLDYFKMNEMNRSDLLTAGFFYRAIEEAGLAAAISVSIRTSELVKVVRSVVWPSFITADQIAKMENPYFFAFKAIIDLLSAKQEAMRITEPVDFIFDDETEKKYTLAGWDHMKLSSEPQFRKFMGDIPSYKNDKTTLPLQAADLYAWWVRKWIQDDESNWLQRLPFPWGKQRDFPRVHMDFAESDILRECQKMHDPIVRRRARITDPVAALRALEDRENGIKMTLPDPSSPLAWGRV